MIVNLFYTRALKWSSPTELRFDELREEFALSTVLAVTDVGRSRLMIMMMFGYMAEHPLLSTIVPESTRPTVPYNDSKVSAHVQMNLKMAYQACNVQI